jgi:hypothetical protein
MNHTRRAPRVCMEETLTTSEHKDTFSSILLLEPSIHLYLVVSLATAETRAFLANDDVFRHLEVSTYIVDAGIAFINSRFSFLYAGLNTKDSPITLAVPTVQSCALVSPGPRVMGVIATLP